MWQGEKGQIVHDAKLVRSALSTVEHWQYFNAGEVSIRNLCKTQIINADCRHSIAKLKQWNDFRLHSSGVIINPPDCQNSERDSWRSRQIRRVSCRQDHQWPQMTGDSKTSYRPTHSRRRIGPPPRQNQLLFQKKRNLQQTTLWRFEEDVRSTIERRKDCLMKVDVPAPTVAEATEP